MAEIVADHDIESGQLPRAGIHHVPPGPCARTPPNATSFKAEDSQIAIAQASLQSGLPDRPERRGIEAADVVNGTLSRNLRNRRAAARSSPAAASCPPRRAARAARHSIRRACALLYRLSSGCFNSWSGST